jgi:hypothetical protein
MSYNLSAISANTTGMLGFFKGVNNVLMFGWLGVLFLLVIGLICFMAFMVSTNDVRKSFIATSFISFGLSIFLRAMSLVPDFALYVCLVLSAISVAWSFSGE